MTFGAGDEIQVFNIEALNAVGMFDERFCGIGYQEADYFLRARLLHPQKVSINDAGHHGRSLNPIADVFSDILERNLCGAQRNDMHHIASKEHHVISEKMFHEKWNNEVSSASWSHDIESKVSKIPKQYMYYPYFERHLRGLQEKYIIV